MKIVKTKDESLREQFVGLQTECRDCEHIIEITSPDDIQTVIPGSMFQRRAARAFCPNCGKDVLFREGDTAWREGEGDSDAGPMPSEYWVRAETEAYALKEAYRNGLACFASREGAEAMETEDAMYRIVVERVDTTT